DRRRAGHRAVLRGGYRALCERRRLGDGTAEGGRRDHGRPGLRRGRRARRAGARGVRRCQAPVNRTTVSDTFFFARRLLVGDRSGKWCLTPNAERLTRWTT